jgi:Tfp pilus assembly protein PilF
MHLRLAQLPKQLLLMTILSFGASACQTTGPDAPPTSKEAQLLESQIGLVRQSLDSGHPENALASLRPLLRARPDDPKLLSLMGLTQLALKNPGRAVAALQKAYRLDKRCATGLNLSAAYIEAGDYEKAAALLANLRKLAEKERYATPERIYHNLALVALKQKHTTHAERFYRQALEENPTYYPTHLELARLYETTRRPAMAMKSYKQALDYCQICYEPLEGLSKLYVKMGHALDARVAIAKYVQNENVAPEDKARADRLLKMAARPTGSAFPKAPRKG